MRNTYELTPAEFGQFRWLEPEPGVAIEFWAKVAKARGLDYTTIVSDGKTFTAMPLGHGKQFCWPLKLKCSKRPKYDE